MKEIIKKYIQITKTATPFVAFVLLMYTVQAQNHPLLMFSQSDIAKVRNSKEAKAPLFQQVLEQTQQEVDAAIAAGLEVPIPKDMAGGYSHERHKQNFFLLQKAGNLFQLTGQEKYAIYIRDLLLLYAEKFPEFGKHPSKKSYSRGKLFWQCLNDANWLVYVSQAYDCVYDWLSAEERKHLEKDLFRPYADYISIDNPQFFNRIHNHSTWGNAAVGMIGLVMNDTVLIRRALYGLSEAELGAFKARQSKDNDGGRIRLRNQTEAGFFAQLDYAFSPDGYYTEGPYYQRYAISPFMLFAKALANNRPDLDIFNYRDGLLKKATYALLYQTDANGVFFPINDAQKGMSFRSRELIAAVDIVYDYCGKDAGLLTIAQQQNEVTLDPSGFAIAKAIVTGESIPFDRKSLELHDGKDGTEGALGILRSEGKNGELCLVFKYTAQGMGHGHYDKLSYALYGDEGEIVQDYGAARWVNIDQKAGGRYLPENKTWAKQTIAHNTVTINETSHFGGKFDIANERHGEKYYFDASNPTLQIASAKSKNAYSDNTLHRTMVLFTDEENTFTNPLVIDLFRVSTTGDSKQEIQQYDLPLWFQGHMLNCNFEYESALSSQTVLGEKNGYQHLWQAASGKPKADLNAAQMTWFADNRFYTVHTVVNPEDELIFARLGANDPKFNLRPDPCLIVRKKQETTKNQESVFVSIIEPHGSYSPVSETPQEPYGQVQQVELLHNSKDYTAIRWEAKNGKKWTFLIANENNDPKTKHQLKLEGKKIKWTGVHHLSSIQ